MSRDGNIAVLFRKKLDSIPEGRVFGYGDIALGSGNEQALMKVFSRMTKDGKIVRLSKGKYYKPKHSKFGVLVPDENQVVKMITTKAGRINGYVTGAALYNQIGLTTQVPNVVTIAKNTQGRANRIGGVRVKYTKRNGSIREADIPLLQLLDVLRDIKSIPDSSVGKALMGIIRKIAKLKEPEIKRILKLSLDYNPGTRALLGAITEQQFPTLNTGIIRKSLNPITRYNLGIDEQILPNKKKWNIR